MSRVYLDWNATAPLRPAAREAMAGAMDLVGNPSSVHAEGRAAKALLERCRAEIAEAAGAGAADIVFTSGATEAAALALGGGWRRVMVSAVEHDCVAENAAGHPGQLVIPVDRDGVVHPRAIPPLGPSAGDLLAVQAANSETGVTQNMFDTSFVGAEVGATILIDAVQFFGKLPLALSWEPPAMWMFSAHKIGGPKGVGALVLPAELALSPQMRGGGQEGSRRAGTENLIGIAGFAAAARVSQAELARGEWERVAELRNVLESLLEDGPGPTISVGKGAPRLPNTLCLIAPGWRGETQVMAMDLAGFAISAGSACSSGKVRESRVLKAMGFGADAACAIRVSLGPATTEDEVRAFADAWRGAYAKRLARAT